MTSSTPPRPSISVRLIALGVVATLVLFLSGGIFAAKANAEADGQRVWVCQYVGTPGGGATLDTGENPLSMPVDAVEGADVGEFVADGPNRSYVIAVDDGNEQPECPRTAQRDVAEPADDTGAATDTTKPVAAPTDLWSTQMTGLASLFAIAAALLGAAAYALRGARN